MPRIVHVNKADELADEAESYTLISTVLAVRCPEGALIVDDAGDPILSVDESCVLIVDGDNVSPMPEGLFDALYAAQDTAPASAPATPTTDTAPTEAAPVTDTSTAPADAATSTSSSAAGVSFSNDPNAENPSPPATDAADTTTAAPDAQQG